MTPQNDTDIIRAAQRGEHHAFAMLVNRHQPRAMTLALRMLGNRQDAEEAVQDAFVRAFRSLRNFEERSSFATWLYRIVYNVCATMLRKRSGSQLLVHPSDGNDLTSHPIADDELPDVHLEESDLREVALKVLETLPPIYRGPLSLFFLDDLGYEEIVAITGLSLSAVKVRLSRGRNLLRRAVLNRIAEEEIEQ